MDEAARANPEAVSWRARVRARKNDSEKGGPFTSLADAMERTGLLREAIENLVNAGAFDSLTTDRRAALWEVGLRYRPGGYQQALPLPVEQDMPGLPPQSQWEAMAQILCGGRPQRWTVVRTPVWLEVAWGL